MRLHIFGVSLIAVLCVSCVDSRPRWNDGDQMVIRHGGGGHRGGDGVPRIRVGQLPIIIVDSGVIGQEDPTDPGPTKYPPPVIILSLLDRDSQTQILVSQTCSGGCVYTITKNAAGEYKLSVDELVKYINNSLCCLSGSGCYVSPEGTKITLHGECKLKITIQKGDDGGCFVDLSPDQPTKDLATDCGPVSLIPAT